MMDSVKIWEIEEGRMADILMKPQSSIFDMNISTENLYGMHSILE